LIEREFGCTEPKVIRGDVQAGRRQTIVDEFSALAGFAVLILSPKAAGVGLNITAANHVIHLDRWWNPAVEDQCTDRAYRIGATKPVWVYALAARHPHHDDRSYDLILHRILERKRELSRSVFAPTEIQAADFDDLLSRREETSSAASSSLLARIDAMTPLAFEDWVTRIAIDQGLIARTTKQSGDGGVDIVVRDAMDRITHLVQCKHTSRPHNEIDGGLSFDLGRMRQIWKAPDAAIVGVTNASRFSMGVQKLAASQSARLVARPDLASLAQIFRQT
jgi:HJR/Mrr/RecB family endonuclease